MRPRGADDERLVNLARGSGHEATEALEKLLRQHERLVVSVSLRILRHREDAADAAQEALLKITRTLDGFRGDCSFTSWVYAVARSVSLDVLDKRRRLEKKLVQKGDDALPEPAAPAMVSTPLERKESWEAVLGSLSRHLTPEESRILVLHHVDGLSMREITERLGLDNRSGARAFLASAKRKLRERSGPHLLDPTSDGS
jgi:RNA polymerase sigma-70 factor (ECF subfamily)